jgi:uncharacterized OB-fold protein
MNMIAANRPLPSSAPDSQEYWDGLNRGELRIQYCEACDRHQFYPRFICTQCAGAVQWITAAGRGFVYSYTTVYQNRMPPFDALVPYVIALVQLDEGPRMLTNITDCPVGDVKIGMPVEFYTSDIQPGTSIHFWRPVGVGAGGPS